MLRLHIHSVILLKVDTPRQEMATSFFTYRRGEKAGVNVHIKFLCVSLLLCLALAGLLFSATRTIQAYQQLQQSHQRTLSGDVSSIDAWMTFPYIARVYQIPENCLYQSLHLPGSWTVRHSTLRVIADHYTRSVDSVIKDVQQVILRYRRDHTICGTPALASRARSAQGHRRPALSWKGVLHD
jgi:hypothetical protein